MILEATKTVIKELWNNKLRTILTMLGIIIGITSVTIVFAISAGVREAGNKALESITMPFTIMFHGNLSKSNLESIRDEIDNYIENSDTWKNQSIMVRTNLKEYVDYLEEKYTEDELSVMPLNLNLQAVDKSHFEFLASNYDTFKITQGRGFENKDFIYNINYALVREDVAMDVYGTTDLVDKYVKINNFEFKVIGLLSADVNEYNFVESPAAVVSFNYYYDNMYDERSELALFMFPDGKADYKATEKDLNKIIKDYVEEGSYYINSISPDELENEMESYASMINLVFGGIASLSLIVGGIGIVNIMLVSVSERVKETGLRIAIGAKNTDIIIQFLLEGIIITVISGMIGLMLAFLGSTIINNIIAANQEMEAVVRFKMIIDLVTAFKVIIFCGFLGIIFGIYPAIKASKLDPVEALKYE